MLGELLPRFNTDRPHTSAEHLVILALPFGGGTLYTIQTGDEFGDNPEQLPAGRLIFDSVLDTPIEAIGDTLSIVRKVFLPTE